MLRKHSTVVLALSLAAIGAPAAAQSFSPSTALQGIPTYIRSVSTSGQITGR